MFLLLLLIFRSFICDLRLLLYLLFILLKIINQLLMVNEAWKFNIHFSTLILTVLTKRDIIVFVHCKMIVGGRRNWQKQNSLKQNLRSY